MRLLITILVMALSAMNCGDVLLCAAYCVSSASGRSPAIHHHQMASQPNATSPILHIHTHHPGVACLECPSDASHSLNQNSGCMKLAEIQALKEGSVSLGIPSGATPVVADRPADAFVPTYRGERSFLIAAGPPIQSSNSPLLPLRI
jgi:hypothetical protein